MLGAIRASPCAAAWMACVSRAGPASLSRNPWAPALSAPWTYFVEVEGRDHDDREGIVDVWAGELPGGFDPVQVGHADVEQAHVGPQLTGERDGVQAVGGLTDDFDVGLGVEEHR